MPRVACGTVWATLFGDHRDVEHVTEFDSDRQEAGFLMTRRAEEA